MDEDVDGSEPEGVEALGDERADGRTGRDDRADGITADEGSGDAESGDDSGLADLDPHDEEQARQVDRQLRRLRRELSR